MACHVANQTKPNPGGGREHRGVGIMRHTRRKEERGEEGEKTNKRAAGEGGREMVIRESIASKPLPLPSTSPVTAIAAASPDSSQTESRSCLNLQARTRPCQRKTRTSLMLYISHECIVQDNSSNLSQIDARLRYDVTNQPHTRAAVFNSKGGRLTLSS